MPDVHYENPRLAEIYDLDSPWSIDREFYLQLAGQPRQRILDLGCGTGLLCEAYAAKNHDVTGVDPSAAMLEVAKRKPHGQQIEWAQSSAQNFKSERRFDLIIMTGHAFQVLLEDDDVLATFSTMRKHMNAGCLLAFESRNPEIDWASRWNYEMKIELPESTVQESRRFVDMKHNRMRFELLYEFPDEKLISNSELRFFSRNEIEGHLISSKLRIESVLGDWDGTPFDESSSEEMIFLVRAA